MTFKDYYQEDYSLSEIANLKNVSRSAVQKTIKTVIDKLKMYESKLHIYEIKMKLSESLTMNDCNKIKEVIKEVMEI